MVIGKQPLARRMLGSAFEEPLQVSRAHAGLLINVLWVALVRAAGGRQYLHRAELCRERLGQFQGVRHHRGDDRVHDSAGLLAERPKTKAARAPEPGARAQPRTALLRERLESRFTPVQLPASKTKAICTRAMPERPEAKATFA